MNQMPMDNPQEVHLTPEQLAARWSVKKGTLGTWRWRGSGPKYIKVGLKKVLYPLSEVEAFERNGMMAATSVPAGKE